MEWKTVQRDFVKRTLTVLTQYDDYMTMMRQHHTEADELEVTLLVNCLAGLIVVPYEYSTRGKRGKELEQIEVCKGDMTPIKDLESHWGLRDITIPHICDFEHKSISPPEMATLKVFTYRVRNSVAHARFADGTRTTFGDGVGIVPQADPDDPRRSKISRVILRDKDERFEAIIPIKSLREFAETFARTVIQDL